MCYPIEFVNADHIRMTRKTSDMVEQKDIATIKWSVKPTCDGFRNCYFYRTMVVWNNFSYHVKTGN